MQPPQVKLRRALDVVGDLSAQESAQAYEDQRRQTSSSSNGHNRPFSAPSVNRDGSRSQTQTQGGQGGYKEARQFPDQKTKNIYGSEYFNLSHYKQNGYKVEVIEEKHRQLHQGRNGGGGAGPSQVKRPMSGGAIRSSTKTSSSNPRAQQRPSSGRVSSSMQRSPNERAGMTENSGGRPNKTSIVDRYMYGEPLPSYLKPREPLRPREKDKPAEKERDAVVDGRLSDMYAPSLVDKLDAIALGGTRDTHRDRGDRGDRDRGDRGDRGDRDRGDRGSY